MQRDNENKNVYIFAGGKSSGRLFRSRFFSFNDFPICIRAHLVYIRVCILYTRDATRIYTFCRQIAYFRTLSLINNRKKSDVWSGGWFFLFSFFFPTPRNTTPCIVYTHYNTHAAVDIYYTYKYNIHTLLSRVINKMCARIEIDVYLTRV